MMYDVVAMFEIPTSLRVPEGDGYVEICINMTTSPANSELDISVELILTTANDTGRTQ